MSEQRITEAIAALIKAQATYDEDTASAWVIFKTATATAQAISDEDAATAWATFKTAIAPAWATFSKAQAAYNKARKAGES